MTMARLWGYLNMSALILDGRKARQELIPSIKQQFESFAVVMQRPAHLVIFHFAGDESSASYVIGRRKLAETLGVLFTEVILQDTMTTQEVIAEMQGWQKQPSVDGVMIDRPLPLGFDEQAIIESILPSKDIDGVHPLNAGKIALGLKGFIPNTARGVMMLLQHYQVNLAGKKAVVVGRSITVGKPLANLLIQANATVTVCHSKTIDLIETTRNADIVFVAIGKKHFITPDYIKENAIVVDIGIHVDAFGHIDGDVHPSVADRCAMFTPVPGGSGPLTNLALMMNLLDAYRAEAERIGTY